MQKSTLQQDRIYEVCCLENLGAASESEGVIIIKKRKLKKTELYQRIAAALNDDIIICHFVLSPQKIFEISLLQ